MPEPSLPCLLGFLPGMIFFLFTCAKVSRERFGKEVEGMLKRWPTFPAALRDLHEMGLLPLLLTTNPEATAAHARAAAAAAAADDATTAGAGGGGGSAPQGGVSAASWEGALGSLDWLAWLLDGRAAAFAQGSGAAAGAGAAAESGTMGAKAVAQAAMLAGAVQAYAGVTVMTGKKRNKPAAAAALQVRACPCSARLVIVLLQSYSVATSTLKGFAGNSSAQMAGLPPFYGYWSFCARGIRPVSVGGPEAQEQGLRCERVDR